MFGGFGGSSNAAFPPAVVVSTGFPDATNTGVPVGTTLTTVTGDFSATSNNQIIDALDVSGQILVNGFDGVTVKRCRATTMTIAGANVTVQDCTLLAGMGVASPLEFGIGSAGPPAADNFTLLRCDLSGAENLLWFETSHSLVKDCYFHDPVGAPTAHIDGIQVPQDSPQKVSNTVRHNNFEMNLGTVSSCCQFDCVTDFIIDNNRFHGGSYELYLLTRGGGTTSGCQVTNNMFVTNSFGGYVDEQAITGLNTYTGNTDENGNPLTLP